MITGAAIASGAAYQGRIVGTFCFVFSLIKLSLHLVCRFATASHNTSNLYTVTMWPKSSIYTNSGHAGSDNEYLEDEQSSNTEKRRSLVEGQDANLTELAAPQVVNEWERGDDLEKEESRARTSENHGESELAEIAAPEPVSRTGSFANQPSRHPSDEEASQAVAPARKQRLSYWTETVTMAWLVFFSLFGTLARLGVEALATYPGASVSSTVLWANVGGSLFLGFLVEDRRLFRYSADPELLTDNKEKTRSHIDQSKKILPLYVGLATGFCGSFTSFSTFITDSFLALSNALPPADPTYPHHTIPIQTIRPRNGGYSFMALLALLIIHPAVSIGALKTGAHLAVGVEQVTPSLPAQFIRRFLDPLVIVLGFGCWAGAVLLSIWPIAADWRYRATMALVFAPPGCLLRFYLSRTLNSRAPSFPLGTFAVNVFGTCIEGMCYDLQHANVVIGNSVSGGANTCAVLEGVMQGFCGCATTVSTWVVELNSLRRYHAWRYGLVSVGVALGFQVIIMGSMAWSVGFDQSCSSRV